jgi:hypothetical protein
MGFSTALKGSIALQKIRHKGIWKIHSILSYLTLIRMTKDEKVLAFFKGLLL